MKRNLPRKTYSKINSESIEVKSNLMDDYIKKSRIYMTKFREGDRVIVFYSDDLIFNGRVHSITHNVGLLYRIIDTSDNLWWFREDQLELDKGWYRNNKIAGI